MAAVFGGHVLPVHQEEYKTKQSGPPGEGYPGPLAKKVSKF